jgi:hypothetical protein
MTAHLKKFNASKITEIINSIEQSYSNIYRSSTIIQKYIRNLRDVSTFKPEEYSLVIDELIKNITTKPLYSIEDDYIEISMYDYLLYNYYTIIKLKIFYMYYKIIYEFYLLNISEFYKSDLAPDVEFKILILNNISKPFRDFTLDNIELLFNIYITFGIYHPILNIGTLLHRGDNDYIYHNKLEYFKSNMKDSVGVYVGGNVFGDGIYTTPIKGASILYGENKVESTGCANNINIFNFNLGSKIGQYKTIMATLIHPRTYIAEISTNINIIINIDGDGTEIIFKDKRNTQQILYLIDIYKHNPSTPCNKALCRTQLQNGQINSKLEGTNYRVINCDTGAFDVVPSQQYEAQQQQLQQQKQQQQAKSGGGQTSVLDNKQIESYLYTDSSLMDSIKQYKSINTSNFQNKYLKYKNKYSNLKNKI